ncbi:unnamed protein product [Danaus chrysippus]|uniref:(African queen) hypothetical protein n=1 Tax=Danaus chrysippus TaxID=151541 RepID=A0A8J2QQY3_9NEOP|nr:unnamed protein product [Danaus chrysippus]
MAAPMREGAPAGGARPAPPAHHAHPSHHAHHANFEYDDNEWDIGIGDLIIDLDADIEKTDEADEAGGMAARAEPDAQRTALKMKIKRTKPGTKSSEAKHEIVKSNEVNGDAKTPAAAAAPAAKRGSGGHRRDKARDKHHHPHAHPHPHPPHDVNGVPRVPPPPNAPGPPAPPPAALPSAAAHATHPPHATHSSPAQPKPEQRPAAPRLEPKPSASPAAAPAAPSTPAPAPPPSPAPAPALSAKPEPDDSRQEHSSQPPTKKQKTEPKTDFTFILNMLIGPLPCNVTSIMIRSYSSDNIRSSISSASSSYPHSPLYVHVSRLSSAPLTAVYLYICLLQ